MSPQLYVNHRYVTKVKSNPKFAVFEVVKRESRCYCSLLRYDEELEELPENYAGDMQHLYDLYAPEP